MRNDRWTVVTGLCVERVPRKRSLAFQTPNSQTRPSTGDHRSIGLPELEMGLAAVADLPWFELDVCRWP